MSEQRLAKIRDELYRSFITRVTPAAFQFLLDRRRLPDSPMIQ